MSDAALPGSTAALRPSLYGLLALAAILGGGCATFAPGAVPGAFAKRDEKKIVKLAEHDPFPSPADVGLTQPTSVP